MSSGGVRRAGRPGDRGRPAARRAVAVAAVAARGVAGQGTGWLRPGRTWAARRPSGMTHAWLFTGPPGSGRSLAARAFAAALLCDRQGCGDCPSCHQVAGRHPRRPAAGPARRAVLRRPADQGPGAARRPPRRSTGGGGSCCSKTPTGATEQAANALLKAIEEPAPRTVWLLCAPYCRRPADDDQVPVPAGDLGTPRTSAVTEVLEREGIGAEQALGRRRSAAQGHIGRARRLATDEEAARRRGEVLRVPAQASVGRAWATGGAGRRAALVKAAEAEAAAMTEELDEPERDALRRAFGEGSTGKGVATALRGAAGALQGSGGPAEVPRHPAQAGLAGPGAARPGRVLPGRARDPARRVGRAGQRGPRR